MARLNLYELAPGMVLAADVRSPQGRLLMPRGGRVDDQLIHACKAWGVVEAEVQGVSREEVEAQARGEVTPGHLEAAKTLALSRFAKPDLRFVPQRELVRQFILRSARLLEDGLPTGKPEPPAQGNAKPVPPLADILATTHQLVSLPQTFHRIVEAVNDPRSSAASIAEYISHDASLAAKLLRLVNSPYYGLASNVESLDRAVALLGSRRLANLALGVSVMTVFRDVPERWLTMRDFWEHCIGSAALCRALAARVEGVDEDRVFVAGLLHDIGKLVMLGAYPDQAVQAMVLAAEERLPAHVAERRVWGFDHAELAVGLMEQWSLPAPLRRTVGCHHKPDGGGLPEACVLQLADAVAHALNLNPASPVLAPPLDRAVWRRLGLSEHLFAYLINHLDSYVQDSVNVFFQTVEA